MADGFQDPCLIWIAGSINAGKSTVAGRLAKALSPAVHLEVDALLAIAGTSLALDAAVPLAISDALVLARRWLDRGFLPVASFPLSADDAALVLREAGGMPVCCITLDPGEDVAGNDRGDRILDTWERDRVRVMYRELGLHRAHLGERIDNRGQTVAQALALVASFRATLAEGPSCAP